jgi:hypothetical protein
LGRRERGWKKKNKRQGEKYRGEEADGVDRRKWIGSAEREQTKGRRRGNDLRQGGNSYRLCNSK